MAIKFHGIPLLSIIIVITLTAQLLPLDTSTSGEEQVTDQVVSSRVLDIDQVDLGLDIPLQSIEYVIICPEDFKEEASPLAVHRTRMGLYTSIFTLEDIENHSLGRDKEEKVHYFLRQVKKENQDLSWLLIMGDSEFLMPRELYHYAMSRGQPFGDQYFSDVYYAGLDSNWDNDLDQVYGEVYYNGTVEADTNWDLYVGRVPASNETQVSNYVNKLLRYEKNPPVGTWMQRFNNWGSLMEPPNLLAGENSYRDYRSNAYKVCQRVNGNLPDHIVLNELYDYPQLEGGNYTPGDGRDTLTRANMLDQFDQGASMLNFVGQARYYAYALNDYGPPTGNGYNWKWNEPLGYGDHAIFNNGDMMPFMYASTCDTAKFFQTDDDKDEYGQGLEDRSLETWLTSGTGGVIGLISSTNLSARGEETNKSWGNWYLDEEFWKLFLNQGETRPGRALFMLKDLYEDEWYSPSMKIKETIMGMIYTYILLGEPYVDIYTDRAERFPDDIADDITVYQGNHLVKYQAKDRNGDPVPGARLTFYSHSTYHTFVADGTGWINERFDPSGDDVLNVTITGHNMVMKQTTLTVHREIQDPALIEDSLTIEPEFPVHMGLTNISFMISNLGGEISSSMTLHVRSSMDDGGNWSTMMEWPIPPLSPRSSFLISSDIRTMAGRTLYEFQLEVQGEEIEEENNHLMIEIDIPGPKMTFEPGTGSIRPSSISRPGANISVEFDIYNQGPGAGEVELQLFFGEPGSGGIPLTTVEKKGKISPDSWLNGSFEIHAPESSGWIYIVMDPEGNYREGMTDETAGGFISINQPPRQIGDLSYTMLEDSGEGILRIDDLFIDPDNATDEMKFTILDSMNLTCTIVEEEENISVSIIPVENWFGSESVGLIFSDGLGDYFTGISIEVLPVNDDPKIENSIDGKIMVDILEDSLFTMTVEASDIDGDNLTFTSEGAPFIIDPDTGSINWIPGQVDVGTGLWTITVEDGNGGFDTVDLHVNIREVNEPPIIEPITVDYSLGKGDTKNLVISYTDEEGDDITISSSHSFIVVNDDMINIVWDGDRPGLHQVTLEISDGVNTVYVTFNVTMLEEEKDEDKKGIGSLDTGTVTFLVILATVIIILFLVFFWVRGTGTDRKVRSELREADDMYDEDMDYLEE